MNGESENENGKRRTGNGERGTGNGELGTGNGESLKWRISKSGNLYNGEPIKARILK